jgi:hypothetical protein
MHAPVIRRTLALASLIAAFAAPVGAQHGPSDAAKERIAHLSSLVGKWKGSGWIMLPTGTRSAFVGEEVVESRLDGRALLVEGLHRDGASGAVVHQAIGLIAWDAARGEYRFGTALASGRTGTHAARMEGKRFVWTLDAPGPPRRFVISMERPDTWEEVGEVSTDAGKSWTRFFEMRLERVK